MADTKSGHGGRNIAIVAVAVVAVLVIAAMLFFIHPPSSVGLTTNPSTSSGLTTNPSPSGGLTITITNAQQSPTPAPFQQMIVLNASKYSSSEAANLGNIRFYQGSSELYSWCESGCSNASTDAVFWVKLPGGIGASSSESITAVFMPVSTNYDGVYAGEAPQLSPTYAEYDNGASVFEYYANFKGPSIPQGWTAHPNGGVITASDGAYLSGGHAHLMSDWPVSSGVAEIYLTSENTDNGNLWVLASGGDPQSYDYVSCAVGYQNQIAGGGTQGGYGLEVQNNNGGTPSIVATPGASPYFPAVIGVYGAELYVNYAGVANVTGGCAKQNSIFGSTYLQMAAETGVGVSNFAFDWVRIRAPPPDGVMPAATVT